MMTDRALSLSHRIIFTDHTHPPQPVPAPVARLTAGKVVAPASTAARIAWSLTTLQWQMITARSGGSR